MSATNTHLPIGSTPLLVSKHEARLYLGGVCLATIDNLIAAGQLPTVKVLRRTMIPYHALVKLAKNGTVAKRCTRGDSGEAER